PNQQTSGVQPASRELRMSTALDEDEEMGDASQPLPEDASTVPTGSLAGADEFEELFQWWWTARNGPNFLYIGPLLGYVKVPLTNDLAGLDNPWRPRFRAKAMWLFQQRRRHEVTGKPTDEYLTDADVVALLGVAKELVEAWRSEAPKV